MARSPSALTPSQQREATPLNRARYTYVPVNAARAEELRQRALAAEHERLADALMDNDERNAKSASDMITYLESRAPAPRYTRPTE